MEQVIKKEKFENKETVPCHMVYESDCAYFKLVWQQA